MYGCGVHALSFVRDLDEFPEMMSRLFGTDCVGGAVWLHLDMCVIRNSMNVEARVQCSPVSSYREVCFDPSLYRSLMVNTA